LKKKFPDYLKSEYHSIKIIHIGDIVFLETARRRHKGINDEIIERIDLSIILEGEDNMFVDSRSPMDNARVFMHRLDEYSIINCTDLFTNDAIDVILLKHQMDFETMGVDIDKSGSATDFPTPLNGAGS